MSGVAFIEGCPHVRGGLYRGVSSCQGWPLRACSYKNITSLTVCEVTDDPLYPDDIISSFLRTKVLHASCKVVANPRRTWPL